MSGATRPHWCAVGRVVFIRRLAKYNYPGRPTALYGMVVTDPTRPDMVVVHTSRNSTKETFSFERLADFLRPAWLQRGDSLCFGGDVAHTVSQVALADADMGGILVYAKTLRTISYSDYAKFMADFPARERFTRIT